jgi:uncharacterized membrane protein HdeD (DUF308 family)
MATRTDMMMRTTDPFVALSANWWAVALRGVVGIVIGLLAFFLPLSTLTALVWLFGVYAFLDGVFNLLSLWRRPRARPWWALLLEGIAGVAAGVISFVWPGITALALVYLIAAWALITGALEIVAAVRLRKEIEGEWLLALSGVFSLLLGGLLAMFPRPGAIGLVWFLGAYAIVFGVLLVGLSFKLRTRYEEMKAHRANVAA